MFAPMSQGCCRLRNPGPGDSSSLRNQERCDPGTRSTSSPMTPWQQGSTALAMGPGPVPCSGLPPSTWQPTWWASLWQVSLKPILGIWLGTWRTRAPCCDTVGRARGSWWLSHWERVSWCGSLLVGGFRRGGRLEPWELVLWDWSSFLC